MTKYVKKPIPVDAWQIDPDGEQPEWVKEAIEKKKAYFHSNHEMQHRPMRVHTLEGTMYAAIGDYLIRGPWGDEYWFNKKEIFEEMYEEVKND